MASASKAPSPNFRTARHSAGRTILEKKKPNPALQTMTRSSRSPKRCISWPKSKPEIGPFLHLVRACILRYMNIPIRNGPDWVRCFLENGDVPRLKRRPSYWGDGSHFPWTWPNFVGPIIMKRSNTKPDSHTGAVFGLWPNGWVISVLYQCYISVISVLYQCYPLVI